MSDTPLHLAQAALFIGLDRAALADVQAAARLRSADRGGAFFRQGDPADGLHLLVTGGVKLVQVDAAGHQAVVRVITRGDMFGCAAAIARGVFPVTAEAVADSHAWMWDGPTLEALTTKYPMLGVNAMRVVGARLGELQDRLLELSSIRVEQRIARTLLRLVRQCGRRVEEGVAIDMPLSRQDLAEMTGTTLFSVSRILSRWEGEGMVRIGRYRVVIINRHGIASLAEDL